MNHRTFLELLNLYIDGEIHSADAAELEKEILANPKRRKLYDDYCRVHRATKLMYDRFREAAASPTSGPTRLFPAPSRSTPLPRSRRKSATMWTMWLGSAVAAGVVVVTMVSRSGPFSPAHSAGEVTAQPEVAATATVEGETSFAAPFAAVVRADPYVAENPHAQSNPFVLTSDSGNGAAIHWSTPAIEQQLSAPFGILSASPDTAPFLAGDTPRQDTRRDRVFRSQEPSEAVQIEPVGYLIHR